MDTVQAERINKLARSLKDLHLAASTEEAFKRAEEILSGSQTFEPKEEKTLNELVGEKKKSQDCVVEEIIIT